MAGGERDAHLARIVDVAFQAQRGEERLLATAGYHGSPIWWGAP